MSYIFPFNTCETPGTLIAQPWFFALNCISTVVLMRQYTLARTRQVQNALISFVYVEAFHAFSNAVWYQWQRLVVHLLVYVMSASVFNAMGTLTRHCSRIPKYATLTAIFIDIAVYIWTWEISILTILTGLAVLATVIVSHFPFMPVDIRKRFKIITIGTGVLYMMFLNDLWNCENMLRLKVLPYHAAVEVVGLILFNYMGRTFLIWEYSSREEWKILSQKYSPGQIQKDTFSSLNIVGQNFILTNNKDGYN